MRLFSSDVVGRNLIVMVGAVIVSCGGSESPTTTKPGNTAPRVLVTAGDGQTATVGAAVPIAPAVIVVDNAGQPVANASVAFAVASGGGSVTGAQQTTGSNGIATVGGWTLGTKAGANTLTATVGSSSATISATGTPGAPASISITPADTVFLQEGATQQLTVQVADTDRYGNHTTGATPAFAVQPAGVLSAGAGGLLTTTGPGLATVTVSIGTVTASRIVGVTGHPSGSTLQSIPLGSRPYGVGVTTRGGIFVTQLDGMSVTRLTADPLAITATIGVGLTPTGISVNRAGTLALVANQFDPSFGFIDLATNTQVAAITDTATVFRTIFSSDGTRAYGTVTTGHLDVIDVATRKLVTTVPIVRDANGIAFSRGGDTLLYVSSMDGNVSVVNTRTNTNVGLIAVPGVLQDLAVSPDGATLYIAHEDKGAIDIYDIASGRASAITMPAGVFGLTLTPDGAQLYATMPGLGRVAVIDRVTGTVLRNIDGVGDPRRVAFDRFGVSAVVSDQTGRVVQIK